jgi:hypothetical protein
MKSVPNLILLLITIGVGAVSTGCNTSSPPPTPPPVTTIPPIPPPLVSPHTPVIEKELMIRDLKVVNSQRATDPNGKWNVRTLFSNMSPNGGDPSAFVLKWLRTWEVPQTVNGFTIAARPNIDSTVINPWIAASGQTGKPDDQIQLDWTKAPFRLLAIVCRTDLSRIDPSGVQNAGEGRFVFGVLSGSGAALPFTVIFEYRLQADTLGKVRDWAKDWHNLGNLADFDEQYLAALEKITDAYSGRGIAPSRPNASSLNQLRTDEIALTGPWELREFTLSATTGALTPDTVKQTPDISFNDMPQLTKLATFVNDNEAQILANTLVVPSSFQGQPFLGGSSLNSQPTWGKGASINNNKARHIFAMNTCNGCHGPDGNVPEFTQVHVRDANEVAGLSRFLTGANFNDPVDGSPLTNNDLAARSAILQQQANISPTAASPSLIKLLLERRNRAD